MSKERFELIYNEKVLKHYMLDNLNNEQLGYESIVNLLNKQDQQITDLEAKLADKEQIIKEMEQEIDGRDKRIDRLEEDYYQETRQLEWVNEQLNECEKQLAEKEKELHYKTAECEKWKTDYENCSKLEKIMSKEHQYCLDNWRASDHDKISFAVEQLEKVKEYNMTRVYSSSLVDKFIDNQIKELKEMNL